MSSSRPGPGISPSEAAPSSGLSVDERYPFDEIDQFRFEDRIYRTISPVHPPEAGSPEAVTEQAIVTAGKWLTEYREGRLTEEEYHSNLRELAEGTGPEMVPVLGITSHLLVNQEDQAARAIAEAGDAASDGLRTEYNHTQFAAAAVGDFLLFGLKDEQEELFDQVEAIEHQLAGTLETRRRGTLSALSLQAAMVPGMVFGSMSESKLGQRSKEYIRKRKKTAGVLGVLAVAGIVALGLKGDTSSVHAHAAAFASHHGHTGARGTGSGIPSPIHGKGDHSGVEQIAPPRRVVYATGTNGPHILHYEPGEHDKVIIRIEDVNPSQSLINGKQINLNHTRGLHALVTVTDRNGEQQVYAAAIHHGQAEISGELAKLVRRHDAMVQIGQNGHRGVERIFSSAVSNGHRVNGHVARALEHVTRIRSHISAYTHKDAGQHRARGVNSRMMTQDRTSSQASPANGHMTQDKGNTPQLTAMPLQKYGRNKITKGTILGAMITSGVVATVTAERRGQSTQEATLPDSGIPFAEDRQDAPTNNYEYAIGAPQAIDETTQLVMIVRRRLSQLHEGGAGSVMLKSPAEGGTIASYRNVVIGIVLNELRVQNPNRANDMDYVSGTVRQIIDNKTVQELYEHLTS